MFNIWKRGLSLLDQTQGQGTSSEHGESTTSKLKRNLSTYRDDVESGTEPTRKRQRGASFKSEIPINPEALKISEEAKARDTIAVFYDSTVKDQVIGLLCSWISGRSNRQRKVSVLIVEDKDAVEWHAHALGEQQRNLVVVSTADLRRGADPAESWLELMGHDVVVMTYSEFSEYYESEILVFSQIDLLIVDRPELALKSDHILSTVALAVSSTSEEEKPRVFGFILKSGTSFRFSTEHARLEDFLGAKFYGISDTVRGDVKSLMDVPKEMVVRYQPAKKVVDTALCRHLRTFDKKEEVFRSEFRAAKTVLREVGSFAADWVWRRALKSIDEHMNPIFEDDEALVDSPAQTEKIRQDVFRTIKDWTFTMPNLDTSSRGFNVSPKLSKLVQILQAFKLEADSFRGIILVRRRITALAIAHVFKTISNEHLPFIRPEPLTGPWCHTDVAQNALLDDFKSGICNLLIATKIAEDGLEIPPCTCIIRYDLFDSDISYAQTRAMAKGAQCHLILMLDNNAGIGRQIVHRTARMPPQVREWSQIVAVRKAGAYPPSNLLQTTEGYHSDSDDSEEEYLLDPTMSGKIYAKDAVSVIYRYMASTTEEMDEDIRLEHVFDFSITPQGKHVCTVLFRPGAPLLSVKGPASATQAAARRAACFEACKQLYQRGLLSYKLFPRPKEIARRLRPIAVFIDQDIEQTKGDILPKLPPAPMPPSAVVETTQASDPVASRNQSLSGTRCYKRKAPEFWKNVVKPNSTQMYPTIVTVDRNHNPQKPYRPILIITRSPLPTIDDFRLYFAVLPSMTYLRPALPMKFDTEQINLLHRYTIRAMRGVINRPFVCPIQEMPFFIAPLDFGWDIELGKAESRWPYPDVSDYIPWDLVVYAAEQHLVPLRTESLKSLEDDINDAVIQDWFTEFTKRYDCLQIRTDLNPLTPLEGLNTNKKFDNLVEYCKAKRKGFEGLVDYSQPLIEVSNLPSVTNRLSPITKAFTPKANGVIYSAKFLIPELCSKFTIPASTMRTLCLLPSIMKRVEDTLLVRELNAMYFNNEINESALHAAITAPSAGVDFNYERLELLGDAYLKYLSSIYLFVTQPTQHEGILHIARQKIISNKALLLYADKSGLPQYVQSKPFMPKMWTPKGYSIFKPQPKVAKIAGDTSTQTIGTKSLIDAIRPGTPPADDVEMVDEPKESKDVVNPNESNTLPKKIPNDDEHLWLGDKCVADVAEAIIGAAFQTGGPDLGLKVVKSLHIPLPFIESWDDFLLKAKAPPPDVTAPLASGVLEAVQKIVGAEFYRPHILAQALTHTSVHGNDMTCYERLEFLGDAVLDFLVIRHIFDLHGRLTPGALTLLKGAMVSNSVLAALSVDVGLHKFLRIESDNVNKAIDGYVPQLLEKQKAEYEEAEREGRPYGQYWLDVEPPKSIADVVESILGALYVSDGFDLKGAQAMYDKVLRPFYDKHISLKTLSHHPTKILFELFQSQGCQEFEITKTIINDEQKLIRCEVVVHDVILAEGMDPSLPFASRRASFEGLDALEGDPQFMARLCDCRAKSEQRKALKRAQRALQGKVEDKPPPVPMDSDEEEDFDV